ncbi:NAD(P)-dependent oxidoreductase [Deinococcus hohokamensis]|uniref:NAD(P)-dependent oxidoreductase n=1 Tax=Deinococcus hohokamensis TaxID=309883 RepID=A0ABV9I8M2_9DEIO
MQLAFLGGTGRTGQFLINQALDRGHTLRVLARTPSKVQQRHPGLTVVSGDARDRDALSSLVEGSDALLSALGPTAGAPHDTMTLSAQHLVDVLPAHDVRRIITLTGAGVPHPGDRPKPVDHLIRLLLNLTQPAVLHDATGHVDLIRRSPLEWTVVRAPRLTDGPVRPVQAGPVGTIRPFVTRASVAAFMLDQLTTDAHLRQAPAISN